MAMKQIVKYLLSSVLAAVVMLMTVGVSYSSISCPKAKNQKSCCAKEQISCCTVEVTDNCCYEENLELQFDFDIPVEKELDSPAFLPLYTTVFYEAYAGAKQQALMAWAYDLPPPKTTLQNLSILQVYRL